MSFNGVARGFRFRIPLAFWHYPIPMKTPNISLSPGADIEGFRVRAATPIDELFAVLYDIEHIRTGASIYHLACDDSENVFSINLATPPPDDTGMPHILEHSVLAGSQRFPVREPFFEMVKMSMATFINAMTGYDTTYYPVCSTVPKDLFNLAEVYFDAVFHPLLTRSTFLREAHHLAPVEPGRTDGPFRIDGIVYSEMKGVFSDPLSLLHSIATRDLLPDTCYGKESGGAPAAIPDLTYEALRRFHAERYQPGLALFGFYGNIPTERYLDFLRPRLASFGRAQAAPAEQRQPRWTSPRLKRAGYPVEPGEALDEKTYLAMNWLCGDATDLRDRMSLNILGLILFGNEGAVLRKALVDSKLGGDLVMNDPSTAGAESAFHIGLMGSEPDRLDAFRGVVIETLKTMSDESPDAESIEAAFQQMAYSILSIDTSFPLRTVVDAVNAWRQGIDPAPYLRVRRDLSALKEEALRDPALFSRLVRDRFLDNPHRLDVVLEPDARRQAEIDAEEAKRLDRATEGLDDERRRAIVSEAAELEAESGRPNSPAELASLPQLSVSDIPLEPVAIPTRIERIADGLTLLVNDVFSNGIVDLVLDFDLTDLPFHLWEDLPQHADAFEKLGAAGDDYTRIARRASLYTGGIRVCHRFAAHTDDPTRLRPSLRISMRMLDDGVAPAMAVLRDLLFELNPRDSIRLHNVLVQARAAYRTDFVQEGHLTVRSHAGRGLNPLLHLHELVEGLPQLPLSERRVAEFDFCYDELTNRIDAIRRFLTQRGRMTASVTGSSRSVDVVNRELVAWHNAMSSASRGEPDFGFVPFAGTSWEGLAAPVQVAFSAMLMPAPHISCCEAPSIQVGAHLVQLDYMLSEIRLKGNAYGAGFSYDAFGGLLTMSSFRDPHIVRTIDVFKGALDYVRNVAWSQADIDRAIIGVAKSDDRPVRPSAATEQALNRYLTGWSDEKRNGFRQGLLAVTPARARNALIDMIEAGMPRAAYNVMASRDKLEAANAQLPAPLAITDVLETE